MDKLFNIFVRDTKDWMESIEVELGECYGNAAKVNKLFERSNVGSEYKEASERVIVYMGNMYKQFSERLDDVREMSIIMETREEELKALLEQERLENEKLREQLKMLRLYDNSKIADNLKMVAEKFNELVVELNNVEQTSEIRELLDLVSRNVNVLKTTEFMRSRKAGDASIVKSAPNLRADIDTDEVVRDYLNGMKTSDLANKYGLGDNGIRERLKRAGVWKGRNKQN